LTQQRTLSRQAITWIFGLFGICWTGPVAAQTIGLGGWNILHVQYPLRAEWTLFAETQLRSLRFYDDFHYHEWGGGILYQPNQHLVFAFGLGDYDTYREGGTFVSPKNNDEFRFWPQLTFLQQLGRLRMEFRYRSEQRFTSQGFRMRFRNRIGCVLPLNHRQLQNQTWFFMASNEVYFTNHPPFFERNRAILGIGYRLSDQLTAHTAYLQQLDYRINDEIGRDFFQVALQVKLKK
jgi:hypothetical protein